MLFIKILTFDIHLSRIPLRNIEINKSFNKISTIHRSNANSTGETGHDNEILFIFIKETAFQRESDK